MTNISRRRKAPTKLKSMGNHDQFLNRITKSLYYSKLPMTDCLSLPVTELAAEFFTEVKSGHKIERLDVEEASRISRNACVSPCSLVLALLYLERLKDCNPEYLQRVAPSELFLVSLMVASKFLNDEGEDDEVFNNEWAQSGDLSISQMNQLEKEFLHAIDWTVFVHNQDFWERLQRLEKDVAYKEAQKRGWFSYTELSCLMNSMQLLTIAHAMINISSICLATYTAGIVTLLGSALVASYFPGTLLSPRQTTNTTDITVDVNPIVDIPTTVIENVPENLLVQDFMPTSLNCNETQGRSETTESNEMVNEHWKWWLNSFMIWLPEYAGLELKESLHTTNDKVEHMNTFRTSTNFVVDSTTFIQNVNWKQILNIDLNLLLHDWRHYANYVTKLTLGHHH
ncbi:PREDICTED: protein CNPPD1 [Dufourea novaeangliae]|uniref:Protein CNPPD1 n=1 Tax=Dufourea novaeangliae TaxID=178035 RepID=A0A154PEJ4_DUFNO|nr:PREDICTED: protein CNPPD1 [Dufourea novaeangliae]KZC09630.1 Protein CNPPD1 [Dufourea novaeangliae]